MNKSILFAGFVLMVLTGCDKKPELARMPEVNAENCQTEVIKKISDRATRQKFSGLCSRRPVSAVGTEQPLNWLEVINPKDQKNATDAKQPPAPPAPEVNVANCQPEALKKIQDRVTRERFSRLCSRGPAAAVGTKQSPNWPDVGVPSEQKASAP